MNDNSLQQCHLYHQLSGLTNLSEDCASAIICHADYTGIGTFRTGSNYRKPTSFNKFVTKIHFTRQFDGNGKNDLRKEAKVREISLQQKSPCTFPPPRL
jgi:hypothetical protein